MRVEKSWGYEALIYNGAYCTKLLVYTKRIASSLHYHEKKHEIFIVHSGKFDIDTFQPGATGAASRLYFPGDYLVLPPLTRHRIRCLEPGTIIETSTHDDPEDCVRLVPSEV